MGIVATVTTSRSFWRDSETEGLNMPMMTTAWPGAGSFLTEDREAHAAQPRGTADQHSPSCDGQHTHTKPDDIVGSDRQPPGQDADQIRRAERFAEILVHARLQALLAVSLGRVCGDGDDRNLAVQHA